MQLKAERRAGQVWKNMPKNEGARMAGTTDGGVLGGFIVKPPSDIPTLADLDISKNEALVVTSTPCTRGEILIFIPLTFMVKCLQAKTGDDMTGTKSKHKTKSVAFRVTEQEYEILVDAADRVRVLLAEYFRMMIISPSIRMVTYKMNDEPASRFSATADVVTEGIERTTAIKSYVEGEEK